MVVIMSLRRLYMAAERYLKNYSNVKRRVCLADWRSWSVVHFSAEYLLLLLCAGFPHFLESSGFFFLKIQWPGKSWKNILEKRAFFHRLVRKSFFLLASLAHYLQFLTFTFEASVRYTYAFVVYENVLGNFFMGILESPGKVLDFFVSQRVQILFVFVRCLISYSWL